MSTDNINLEEMVEKTLESTGVLPKMRAELRANVFHVLEKGSSFQNKLYTDKIKDFVSNNNGSLLLSLVKDLFEYLELTFTTSVFDSETGATQQYQYKDKNDIFEELSLSKDDKRPLLLQILETYQSQYKSTNEAIKHNNTTQHNNITHKESSLAQILQNNSEIIKSTLDNNKSMSISPVKTKLFEENTHYDSQTGSLSPMNLNLSDNIHVKDIESSESLNSLNIEKLSPIKISSTIDQNENTDEDIKFDLKSNKNESSLEDIETDENLSCGNDSLPSTDLSTQNGSPEMIRTHNIHL
ncbi:FGFR1 oncogene partner-like [Melanaphis sacchari]|uniref:FGFR1 oncogene partner n=1 Tax=Melanaphis sacchari TaxID=742174 RepID=A0A2H8TVH4_9HEMI|nr:FGFR1 oncogene partner-like [Melanaphis sacchari]